MIMCIGFVCYLKIINTFLFISFIYNISKINACILKWIVQGTQKWH